MSSIPVADSNKAVFGGEDQNIVIIGGGIIGVCTAYYLAKADHHTVTSITILEANEIASGASGKAAGFLAEDWLSGSTSSLGFLSFALHTELARELNGEAVYGYRRLKCFGGRVDISLEEDAQPTSTSETLTETEDQVHIINIPPAQPTRTHPSPLSSSDADEPTWLRSPKNFPQIADEKTTAQLHPLLFTQTIFQECLKLGVKYIQGRAISWIRETGTLNVQTQSGGGEESLSSSVSVPATKIIIAAGPWSGRVAEELLKINLPITYLPGHSLILQSHSQPSESATSDHQTQTQLQPQPQTQTQPHCAFVEITNSKKIDLANLLSDSESAPLPAVSGNRDWSHDITRTPEVILRPDGTIYIAGENTGPPLPNGTKEVAACIDYSGAMEKLRRTVRVLGIRGTEVKQQLCYRPLTTRGPPLIGKLADIDNVFIATGHGPWGISLAPGTGKVLSEIVLTGHAVSADISGLDPNFR